MKRKRTLILLSLLTIIFTLFSSCARYPSQSPSSQPNSATSPSAGSDNDVKIKYLESQLALLTQSQAANEEEYQTKLEYLQNELEKLKKQNNIQE